MTNTGREVLALCTDLQHILPISRRFTYDFTSGMPFAHFNMGKAMILLTEFVPRKKPIKVCVDNTLGSCLQTLSPSSGTTLTLSNLSVWSVIMTRHEYILVYLNLGLDRWTCEIDERAHNPDWWETTLVQKVITQEQHTSASTNLKMLDDAASH